MQYIKESELGNLNFPTCICPYKNRDSYMLVEVNTGSYKGSLKLVSDFYSSLDELYKNMDSSNYCYPLLGGHLIFNDITGRL